MTGPVPDNTTRPEPCRCWFRCRWDKNPREACKERRLRDVRAVVARAAGNDQP